MIEPALAKIEINTLRSIKSIQIPIEFSVIGKGLLKSNIRRLLNIYKSKIFINKAIEYANGKNKPNNNNKEN